MAREFPFFVDFFRVIGLFCDKFQLFAATLFQGTVETGLVACVALAALDRYFQKQAILVAVDKYLLDFLDVAAFFAFFPQFPPFSAEIDSTAGLNG